MLGSANVAQTTSPVTSNILLLESSNVLLIG